MLNLSRSVKFLLFFVIFALLLVFGVTAWVFLSRPPVLIVTDISFTQLYGPERLGRQSRRISYSFFRQVIPVLVDESAGPELVAIAVEESFAEPWAVIFPYRYIEGARRYTEAMPETPVFVIGGPGRQEIGTFSLVSTDTRTDLYRAGMAAALFTGEKRPLLFSDGTLSTDLREIFRQGLVDQGCLQEPVFLNSTANYSSWPEIGCVVVAGPAVRFAEQDLDIPVILFSWLDPAFTPVTVKLVFDDSHFALAVEVLTALPARELLLPSTTLLFRERIEGKDTFTKLEDIIRKK